LAVNHILLPELSLLALRYIWLPVSSVDIERSFYSHKSILSDRRVTLKKESIKMLKFLYFNPNGNIHKLVKFFCKDENCKINK
jgi:hypothetical protein